LFARVDDIGRQVASVDFSRVPRLNLVASPKVPFTPVVLVKDFHFIISEPKPIKAMATSVAFIQSGGRESGLFEHKVENEGGKYRDAPLDGYAAATRTAVDAEQF
jgi:hypothetical protein